MGPRPSPARRVDVEVLNTSRQTPLVHDQHTAHKKSMIADTDTHVFAPPPANPSKGKPLGLNLVTDFDSLTVPRPTKRPSPTLVDLTDLKTLCRKRERERSAQKVRGILKKRRSRAERAAAAEGRLGVHHHEHQKKKRKSELSPYDRPIPIGLTISYAESFNSQDAADPSAAENLQTPLTPSIVVTPAREDSFWEDDVEELDSPHPHFHPRPRVTSSVYSQPTPLPMFGEEIPPVPAIPANHSTSKLATPVSATPTVQQQQQQRAVYVPRKSRFSTVTDFEDDSPQSASSSSVETKTPSREEKKKALDRLSINTDTNRHQSQGWWTYLLSPLFKRSSTATSSKTPTSPDRPPLIPRGALVSDDSKVSTDDWWEKEGEVSCFSPDTPESAGVDESTLSKNPFLERNVSNDGSSSASAGAAGGMFAGQAIQGCAAEYYQACAHELFSGTPYFECTNHVCSMTPATQQQRTGRALVVADDHEHGHGNTTRGLDEHKSPNSETTRTHRFSGSTAINETPVVKGKDTPNLAVQTGKPVHLAIPVDPKSGRPTTPPTPFYLPIDQEKAKAKDPNTLPPNTHATVTVQQAIPHHIVVPQSQGQGHGQPQSPNPISPAFQQATEGGSIPLSKVQNTVYTTENYHHVNIHGVVYNDDGHSVRRTPSPPPHRPDAVVTRGISPTSDRHRSSTQDDGHERTRSQIETRRWRHEKEEKVGKKASGLWRGRGPFSKKGCFGRSGGEGRKKRRRCCFAIAFILLVIVIIALLLAVFLTRKAGGGGGGGGGHNNGDDKKGNGTVPNAGNDPSQWLNLTGYPPMPMGIATIAGPKPRVQQSGCIHPTTLWSCALPKEQQDGNQPYDADEPSFHVDIRFQNGTYPQSTRLASRGANASTEASPSPPSQLDQQFLGNTTDGNEAPFNGEETPFYMTFLSTHNSSSSSSSSSTSSDLSRRSSPFPNLTDIIPSPETQPDGTVAPATLYPLPESQPIRLYNRGKDSEHYGFYTYFDRSIFLASSAPLNGGIVDSHLTDRTGGSTLNDASVRCTWAQTRFLVQIWTGQAGKTLLQDDDSSGSSNGNYTRPGTFPYPVTITLDRHGGTAKQKMVYCYGMDDDGGHGLNATAVKLQIEDRGYKGSLVSPAPGVFNSSAGRADEGVDGGDGGCKCQWTNWGS